MTNQAARNWIGEMDPVWIFNKPLPDLVQLLGWKFTLISETGSNNEETTPVKLPHLFKLLEENDHCLLHLRKHEQEGYQILKITMKQLPTAKAPLRLLELKDLTSFHRKELMDRLFFHDIRNTVTEILGFSEVLTHPILKNTVSVSEQEQILESINNIARELADEVDAEKKLLAETSSTRSWKVSHLGTLSELERLSQYFEMERRSKEFRIQIDPDSEDIPFTSIAPLLRRVLTNIFKNANEASKPGDLIKMGCRMVDGDRVQFWIKNPALISEKDHQRFLSVSPRVVENVHGLGTYSIRILTERFLHGSLKVEVDEEGTCLRVTYPQVWQDVNP